MGIGALAGRVQAGDRDAFAELYEEYAKRVYGLCLSILRDRDEAVDAMHDTFVVAVQRIDQLRDPDRLGAWLFAIGRHLCFRRLGERRLTAPVESDLVVVLDDDADELTTDEAAALVWAAASGLGERDRALVHLHLVEGLDGPDLAAAIGVDHANPYSLLHRARAQLTRALDVLVVARVGRGKCEELQRILADWDGTLTPLVRKRVGRHIDHCATCERIRRDARHTATLAAALSASPALADTLTPAEILEIAARRPASSERWQTDGFPPPLDAPRRRRRKIAALVLIAALGILLVGATAAESLGSSSKPAPEVPTTSVTTAPTTTLGTRPRATTSVPGVVPSSSSLPARTRPTAPAPVAPSTPATAPASSTASHGIEPVPVTTPTPPTVPHATVPPPTARPETTTTFKFAPSATTTTFIS